MWPQLNRLGLVWYLLNSSKAHAPRGRPATAVLCLCLIKSSTAVNDFQCLPLILPPHFTNVWGLLKILFKIAMYNLSRCESALSDYNFTFNKTHFSSSENKKQVCFMLKTYLRCLLVSTYKTFQRNVNLLMSCPTENFSDISIDGEVKWLKIVFGPKHSIRELMQKNCQREQL